MIDKVVADPGLAVADIAPGAIIAVGGFGVCGVPGALIEALVELGSAGLRVVSNNCGLDDSGLGLLLAKGRIAKMTSSYVGENVEFARQYLGGELEVELVPQGTLAERLRAGGCGIPAFYTTGGVGTLVAEGGLPWRYAADGSVALASPRKEVRRFGDHEYVLEEAILCDFALVHAWRGDRAGNLMFHESARNFNPLCAMAGRVTIAEVEELLEPGDLPPDEVHLPGIFVQRVVSLAGATGGGVGIEKRIEKRTVRQRDSRLGLDVQDRAGKAE
jgi:3-oxoacid CoA-transferase subunit A